MNDPTELDRFLRPALEIAVVVARRISHDDGPNAIPSRLRPFLRFTKLPNTALTASRLALEEDDGLRAAVIAIADEETVGRGAWLWLARPDGWREHLDAEWDVWHEEQEVARREAAERSASKSLEKADTTIRKLEARVSQLEEILRVTEADLAAARAGASVATVERDEALAEAGRRVEERAEAVRQLKTTEQHLAARTSELRDAIAIAAPPPVDLPELAVGPDPGELAGGLRALRTELDGVVRAVARLTDMVGLEDPAQVEPGGAPRRRAVRIGRGILEDSTAAASKLLELTGVVVLVDGYNLTMTVWPGLSVSDQRRALLRAMETMAARTGAEIHLVFDGDDDGGAPPRTTDSNIRVRFTTADVEADDEILGLIATVQLERPVVVVSDDRRVRRGASERGANVVGSRQLQPLLLR